MKTKEPLGVTCALCVGLPWRVCDYVCMSSVLGTSHSYCLCGELAREELCAIEFLLRSL